MTVTRLDLLAAAFVAVALAVSAYSVGFQRGLDLAREWEHRHNNESERADGYRRALWNCQDELSTLKVTP